MLRALRHPLRKFRRDEEGAALVFYTVMAAAIVGMIGLAVDGARLMTLNTELQDLADAAALAGAKELDGQDATETRLSAIARARDAAFNLLNNNPRWADNNGGVQILEPVFYESLTAPRVALGAGDSMRAHFIEVTTVTRTLTGTLIAAVAPNHRAMTNARAVAGATSVACKVPPLMICAPSNDVENFSPVPGKLYRLKAGGGGAFEPGIMGLLDPPGMVNSGGSLTRELLASTDPHFCYVSGVSAKPGNSAGPTYDGMNVRFDIYSQTGGGVLKNYPPAPNVTKGMLVQNAGKNNCSYDPAPAGQAMGIPRGTPEPPDVPFGAGSIDWPRQAYWDMNHTGKTKPANFGTMSRWAMYQWETSAPANLPSSPTKEIPTPQCYTNPVTTDANRRAFYVAIVNCAGMVGNSVPVSPVNKYAKFFMTEPADTNGNVFAEFIEMVVPGDDNGVLHEIIQLYE